jgi:hypothetical protein
MARILLLLLFINKKICKQRILRVFISGRIQQYFFIVVSIIVIRDQ